MTDVNNNLKNDPQFDFLSEYINSLFDEIGLGDMNEMQKNVYIPRFTALLEERIGLTILPLLNQDQLTTFGEMLNNSSNVDSAAWSEFWHGAVPDFDNKIAEILKEFAKSAQALSQK